MSRILAIDYGLKRIGIAVSDPLNIIASPLITIDRKDLFVYLKKYFSENDVGIIVLGFPSDIEPDKAIVKTIKKVFTMLQKTFTDKKIVLQDERYTSKIASHFIRNSNVKKKVRSDKKNLDKISASIILGSYLNMYHNNI